MWSLAQSAARGLVGAIHYVRFDRIVACTTIYDRDTEESRQTP
jgi:hypothetical protein